MTTRTSDGAVWTGVDRDHQGAALDHPDAVGAVAARLRLLAASVELHRIDLHVPEAAGPSSEDIVTLARAVWDTSIGVGDVLALRLPTGDERRVNLGTLVRGACQRIEPVELPVGHPLLARAGTALALAVAPDGRRWLVVADARGATTVRLLAWG
ncbi:MAG: hypothetical protein JJT89_13965 [Nitriliruptoraceae bacterium]|nr:hypothetical protein [Nitriliruptoraceae bacterium]